jgi:HD-GYP domain-containing protein (c-di-GMP phosphodiesterase class II)
MTMQQYISEHIHPGVIAIKAMLRKIDCIRPPLASRRDIENVLVRQVSKEIDRALPWQAGHGRRTATISLLIGKAAGLTSDELHDLRWPGFDRHLQTGTGFPEEVSDGYTQAVHARV